MLGLDFAPANSALKADLNLARVVGGGSRKPSKTVNVPPNVLRKRRDQVSRMGDFLFDAANFTDRSGPFANRLSRRPIFKTIISR